MAKNPEIKVLAHNYTTSSTCLRTYLVRFQEFEKLRENWKRVKSFLRRPRRNFRSKLSASRSLREITAFWPARRSSLLPIGLFSARNRQEIDHSAITFNLPSIPPLSLGDCLSLLHPRPPYFPLVSFDSVSLESGVKSVRHTEPAPRTLQELYPPRIITGGARNLP